MSTTTTSHPTDVFLDMREEDVSVLDLVEIFHFEDELFEEMETRLQHRHSSREDEEGQHGSDGINDEVSGATDGTNSTQEITKCSSSKKGRRRRKRAKVKRERLNSSTGSCETNVSGKLFKIFNPSKCNNKIGDSSRKKNSTSWLDGFDEDIESTPNSNSSWLDCDTFNYDDGAGSSSLDLNVFTHSLDKYKQRYHSDKTPVSHTGDPQTWNNEKAAVRNEIASKIGTNVNNLHRNVSNKFDGTKRSRRKTEPFNFTEQADGDVDKTDLQQSGDAQSFSSWDIPTGLCNFMADGGEDSLAGDYLDGRSLLSGSISGKGLFVPFENIDERITREDSLGKIFEEDHCDDSDELGSNSGYDSDSARSESDDDDEDRKCNDVFGALPPEPQLGNVEYKLKLVNPTKQRFEHLVTQMKWRLREGQGEALYEIGVRDCGRVRGLAPVEMRASLRTLRRMAARLGAACTLLGHRRLPDTKRTLVEVLVRKIPDDQHNIEVRVAVMGSNDAGKSTLVGVLTQGELDNGRGSARLNMFRHLHEVKTGRTSSVSHEILGFDLQGRPINYAYSELMTSEEINERSSKLVSFIDLAGHRKYLKTTVQGLTGYSPHYAMLVVSATAGITQMTLEHLALVVALDLPFFVIVTKIDATSPDEIIKQLEHALKTIGCRKVPLSVMSMDDAVTAGSSAPSRLAVPVLPVSSVTGKGLDALRWFLFLAPPVTIPDKMEQEPIEFQVDEIFKMGDANGPVVGGLLKKGILTEKTKLLIGPLESGDFVPISVNSLHRNKAPCRIVRAGQAASLGLSWLPPGLRQGMFLLAIPDNYKVQKDFQENIAQLTNKYMNKKDKTTSGKQCDTVNNRSPKFSKKNKRDDINDIENRLIKIVNEININNVNLQNDDNNLYTNRFAVRSIDSKLLDEDQINIDPTRVDEAVVQQDPDNPRGCFFFQATVSLLNNSAAVSPGCQSTVHIGNIRQTAVIEGILSSDSLLRANEQASVLFRFMRHPEFVRTGARILFRQALHTKGVGRVTQTFPHRAVACCTKHAQDNKSTLVTTVDSVM